MRLTAVLVAVLLVAGAALAQNASDRQSRVVVQLIPLNYLDAATVVAIFGGTIIPNYSTQRMIPMAPRGGYGGNYGYSRAGAGIGGSYVTPRTYGYGYGTSTETGYSGAQPYGYGYFR